MGYYVRSLSWKKSAPHWKLQFISYQMQDLRASKAKKPKKEWDIPPDRWRNLGFHPQMTITEALGRAKQLNAQAYLKRQEERIKKDAIKNSKLRHQLDATLPEEFVVEFEQRFVRARDSDTIAGKRRVSRAQNLCCPNNSKSSIH